MTGAGEVDLEQLEQWLAQAKTLFGALELVDPASLPASFRSEVLAPVLEGRALWSEVEERSRALHLLERLAGLAAVASGKPWYFWEQAQTFISAYCGAEACAIYRQGERMLLHKIHPLGPEEDIEELSWPQPTSGPLIPFRQEGQAQGYLLRLGPLFDHPLVLHCTRAAVAPRIRERALAMLDPLGQLIFSLVSPYFPRREQVRGLFVVSEDQPPATKSGILGRDPVFLQALAAVKQAALSDAPVYFKGESGTGKELFARYLHEHSAFKDGPFVPINCSAIPGELIESEMFGHEKGAFTGAYYRKIGKAEQANGGTLFLDEIGEMPLAFQAKLLRFLQEKRFTRVGGNQQVTSDARIVVATHRDLKEMVAHGTFREDLYYRVHVIPISILPLRERGGDIRFLAEHFFRKFIAKSRMSRRTVDEAVFEALENYGFPGNVRELENIVQRTVVMTQQQLIGPEDLPEEVHNNDKPELEYRLHPFERFDHMIPRDRETLRWLKKEVEAVTFGYQRDLDRRFLLHMLDSHDGSARKAAESAGINRTLFYKLLKRAGLDIGTIQKGES